MAARPAVRRLVRLVLAVLVFAAVGLLVFNRWLAREACAQEICGDVDGYVDLRLRGCYLQKCMGIPGEQRVNIAGPVAFDCYVSFEDLLRVSSCL